MIKDEGERRRCVGVREVCAATNKDINKNESKNENENENKNKNEKPLLIGVLDVLC